MCDAVVRTNAFYLWDHWVPFSLSQTHDNLWKVSVNALPKVMGFLRVLWFPPVQRMLTGWVGISPTLTDPSTVAVLSDQTWVVSKKNEIHAYTTARKSVLEWVKLQRLVAKCCKMKKI
jgi:hypothetical protein